MGKEQERLRKYNASPAGVARNLRAEHALDRPTSEYWAARMFDPGSRCSICGLPTYMLTYYRARGPWPYFLGKRNGSGSHPRLTLDHVEPGDSGGPLRLLCHSCNMTRGASRMTDEDVLLVVRRKWEWVTPLRFLWWLNESPGLGGRLHRSEACRKRDAGFAAGARSGREESGPPTASSGSPDPSAPVA